MPHPDLNKLFWINTKGETIKAPNGRGKVVDLSSSDELVASGGYQFLYFLVEVKELPFADSPKAYCFEQAGIAQRGDANPFFQVWLRDHELGFTQKAFYADAGDRFEAIRDFAAMTDSYDASKRLVVPKGEVLTCTSKYACRRGAVVLRRKDGSGVTSMALSATCPNGYGVVNPYLLRKVA